MVPYLQLQFDNYHFWFKKLLTGPPVGSSTMLSSPMTPLMTSVATRCIFLLGCLVELEVDANSTSHANSTSASSLSSSSLCLLLLAATLAGFRRRLPMLSLSRVHALQSCVCSVHPMRGLLLFPLLRQLPQLRQIFLGWISSISLVTSIPKVFLILSMCLHLSRPLFGLGHFVHR